MHLCEMEERINEQSESVGELLTVRVLGFG